jgi:hypothetical protein
MTAFTVVLQPFAPDGRISEVQSTFGPFEYRDKAEEALAIALGTGRFAMGRIDPSGR